MRNAKIFAVELSVYLLWPWCVLSCKINRVFGRCVL